LHANCRAAPAANNALTTPTGYDTVRLLAAAESPGNIPKLQPLATAEFKTLQMRLIKIAARISETATRVRIAFAAACPEAELFAGLVRSFQPAGP
jgi:DDE family transposase